MSISTEVTEQTLTDGSTVFGVLLTGDGGCVKFDCVSEQAACLLDVELRQSVHDFTAMDGASVIGAVEAMTEFNPGAAPPQESDFTALEIELQSKSLYGVIAIEWFDGIRYRKAIAEVDGETIKAGVKYRIDGGKFVPA